MSVGTVQNPSGSSTRRIHFLGMSHTICTQCFITANNDRLLKQTWRFVKYLSSSPLVSWSGSMRFSSRHFGTRIVVIRNDPQCTGSWVFCKRVSGLTDPDHILDEYRIAPRNYKYRQCRVSPGLSKRLWTFRALKIMKTGVFHSRKRRSDEVLSKFPKYRV